MQGYIPIFLIFAPKHRLWGLVTKRVPTMYVLSKNKKTSKNFLLKNLIFYNFKNLCVLHGHVFEMVNSQFMSHVVKCYLINKLNKNVKVFPCIEHYHIPCIISFGGNVFLHLSRLVGKPTMWFPTRSNTNRPVQAQKMARGWKFWI